MSESKFKRLIVSLTVGAVLLLVFLLTLMIYQLFAINAANKEKKELMAVKAEYEQNMLEAKNKANDILISAQKTAAVQSEAMLKEAASQAAAIKVKAENDIAQEKRKAVNEIKGETGGMAMEIAGKVIEREICEEDHRKLIDEFISNVGEAS